jgi:hypothetical protein
MISQINAALEAVQGKCAWMRAVQASEHRRARQIVLPRCLVQLLRNHSASAILALALSLGAVSAQAGLRQPDNMPLMQFGFGTGPELDTLTEYTRHLNVTNQVLGAGGIVRTGLGWDPTKQNVPGFANWSETVLEPALARGITVLPNIKTLALGAGLRMPTDAQWTSGLREIVRMYGPGGVYAKGGTYNFKGRTVRVAPHSSFKGLTDYELWNEPNTQGNLNGTLTSAKMAHLLKIGSAAMRAEAARLGFKINIVGPAIGGANLAYLTQLWQADNNLFSYINTLSFHIYMKVKPSLCDPNGLSKLYCIRTLALIRNFLDTHGGRAVHLAMTEGGFTGSRGTCLGPQVLTEELQSAYNEEAMRWLRANAYIDYDFWITIRPIDGTATYAYPCDSDKYDHNFWAQKHGVLRADMSLKVWGVRYRQLANMWR